MAGKARRDTAWLRLGKAGKARGPGKTPGPSRWPSTLIGDALYGLHALVADAEGNDTPERKTRQRGS